MPAPAQVAKARIDLSRYELSLDGQRVKLERQPMELLILLVQHHGQLASREEIINRLWGKDVFVDVDRSINAAVRKIRAALRDDPAHPRYLETVVGKGYRFVGNIELSGAGSEISASAPTTEKPATQAPPTPAPVRRERSTRLAMLLVTSAIVAAGVWALVRQQRAKETPQTEIRSIAVLPLQNLSGDPSQDYFADGMTEELTTDLGKISSLTVISRTSAQNYRGSQKAAPQIARELNVQALVEGSVLRSGSQVRITTQLIDALHDRHIWAESYERDVSDALGVQNTVALEIAREIRIHLSPAEQGRLEQHIPLNPDAYEDYLRGRYSQTTQSAEGLKEGLPDFQRAIELDPTYAPAYAGLADTYSLLANYGVLAPSEAFPQAAAAANKAVQLDPASAEAHVAAAFPEHHYFWQWAAAEHEYKTALALNPSYSTAHLRYADYLSTVGRHDEAVAEMRRAVELDPLSLVYLNNLGRVLYQARRYDEAIEVLKKTLALDPNRIFARMHLAMCYEEKGMYQQEREEYQRITAALGPTEGSARFYARIGDTTHAKRIVDQLRAHARDSDWFFLAGVYAALGDKNEAFACLNKAYKKHDYFLVFLKVHPFMDPLRLDSRYSELVDRMRFP